MAAGSRVSVSSRVASLADTHGGTLSEKASFLSSAAGAEDRPPALGRRDTIQEHSGKIGAHFQDLQDEQAWVPWAAERPGHNAYSSPQRERSSYIADTELPPGWEVHTHPDGSIYYEKKEDRLTSNFDLLRTTTEHQDILTKLRMSPSYEFREDDWEVNLAQRDGKPGYIWIDHEKPSASALNQHPLLFRDDMNRDDIASQLKGQARYWEYVQGHPNHLRKLPDGAWQQAHDALSWCYADRLLFKHTNATFSKEDSKELLEMLERLEKKPGPLHNWFIASVLRAIVLDRHDTHYGRHDAHQFRQREAGDMVGSFEEFTAPIKVLYYGLGLPVFLGMPHTYFRRIQDVDRTRFHDGVNAMRWKIFVRSLLKEWSDSNLLATVLISATVAFLAVPGLEDNSRMLGLLSVLLAIGSVLVGMFFVWSHQARAESSADVGLSYFLGAKHYTNSSVPLAFILSVPIVLLLWSLLCFITAILIFAFHGTQQRADDMFAKFSRATSPTTLAMFSLVLACAFLASVFMWRVWTYKKHRRSHEPSAEGPAVIVPSRARPGMHHSPAAYHPDSTPDRFTHPDHPDASVAPARVPLIPVNEKSTTPPRGPEHSAWLPSHGTGLTERAKRTHLESPSIDGDLGLQRLFGYGNNAHDLAPTVPGEVARARSEEPDSKPHLPKKNQRLIRQRMTNDITLKLDTSTHTQRRSKEKGRPRRESFPTRGRTMAVRRPSSLHSLASGSDGWDSPSPHHAEGAIYEAIETVHATVHAPRPQGPAEHFVFAKARRGSAPPLSTAHARDAEGDDFAKRSRSLARDPPHLPALVFSNALGLDVAGPPGSLVWHRASSDPDLTEHQGRDVFGPVRLQHAGSWDDLRSTRMGKHVDTRNPRRSRTSYTKDSDAPTVNFLDSAKRRLSTFLPASRPKSPDPGNMV